MSEWKAYMVPVTWPFELTLIKDQAQVLRAVSSEAEGKGTIPVESRAPRHNTHPASVRPVCLIFFFFSFSFPSTFSFLSLLPLSPYCRSQAVRL